MAERKTNEQRLAELEKKMKQLKAQKKELQARQRGAEHKARTRRLIEIGAEVEAALGFSLDTIEARKALGEFLKLQESRGLWVTKHIQQATAAAQKDEVT